MSETTVRVDKWQGPRPLRDRYGRAVVRFYGHEGDEAFGDDWTASVIGWGSELVAASPSLEVLARYIENRFRGWIAVAQGRTVNPLGWPEAAWS